MSSPDLLQRKLRLAWIDTADLFVDTQAQRERLDQLRINKIVKEFDPNLFEALHVNARRGGKYAVTEGGHRLKVAEILGLRWLPCVVTTDRSGIAREAQTFLGIARGRKQIDLLDQHRVGVTAEDPTSVEIQRVVDQMGLRIGRSAPDSIRALRPLGKALLRGNLEETLDLIIDAWELEDGHAFEANIVEGVSILLSAYGYRVEKAKLASRLGAESADAFMKKVREKSSNITARKGVCAAYVLLEIYNYRKPVVAKLDPALLAEWASPIGRGQRSWVNRRAA